MNDPITVFGGTGFLGQRLVAQLLRRGHRVRLVARRPERARFTDESALERVAADLRHQDEVDRAVAGGSVVINAVSLYVEHRHLSFDDIHVQGAARLAAAARRAGIPRLLHLSGIGADQASPSPYVRARARGEAAVREAFPEAALVRPSALFGAGDALITGLARLTLLPAIPLFGAGRTRLQPVWVDDAAAGLAALALQPGAPAPVYELGGAEVLAYRDLVRAVARHLGRRRMLLSVPFPVWHAMAACLGRLPSPPLTRDQVWLMDGDNLTSPYHPGFAELGLSPKGVRDALPLCLGPPR